MAADMMAVQATIHTTGTFERAHFHPMLDTPAPALELDDPGAEYDRLMREAGQCSV